MLSLLKYSLIFLSVVLLAACGGAEDRKAKYISEADERFESRDFDKAKLGYKNAIQIDPKDPLPRIGLAKVFVAEKSWREAAAQYQGALAADPENNEAAIELGKVFLLARGTSQALEQAENVLSRDPENIDALTLKAGAMIHTGQSEEAHTLLASLNKRDPGHLDTAVLYATSLNNRRERLAALDVIDLAIKSNTSANDLFSMKALILDAMGEQTKALDVYRQLAGDNPESFGHKQRLLAYLIKIGQQDEAEAELRGIIAQEPDNLDARKALVDMLVSQKKLDQASEILASYIKDFPKEYDFQMGAARLSIVEGDKARAISILNDIIKSDPEGPSAANAELELAKLDLSKGKQEQVKERLDRILLAHSTNREALLLRGRIALQESRSVDAVNDFRSVLANDPDDASVIRLLAEAHFQAREFQLAENYLKQITHRFPRDVNARMSLARLYQTQGNTFAAIEIRQELNTLVPQNTSNLIELAKLYMNASRFEDVRVVAEKLKNVEVENAVASGHYFAAAYYQSQNQHEKAITALDQALIITPTAIEPLSSKVKSLLVLERQTEAEEWLRSLIENQVNEALARNLLGELFIFGKQFGKARTELTLAIELNPQWVVPRKNLALSYRQEGDIESTIQILSESLEVVPDALPLRVELAQLYEASQNVDEAIAQYEYLTQLPEAPLFASNNLAMLLVTYRDDDASLEQATKVAEALRGQDNPNFMDTLGWIYFKNSQYDLALPLIKAAAEKSPSNPQINYHLAKTFVAKQDVASAKRYFEKALSSDISFVGRKDAETILKSLQEQG